jgi:Cys-tRNA(Pro) deacylase
MQVCKNNAVPGVRCAGRFSNDRATIAGPAQLAIRQIAVVQSRHYNAPMSKSRHVSETPATQFLRRHGITFGEHPYDYVEHGGTGESARQLGVDEHHVVKTLVMEDEHAKPLIVLMHGDRTVSTKNLARQIGAKRVEPCKPEVANRHSGYLIGGTSPFGTKKQMPVYVESSILEMDKIWLNGGRRGFLVSIDPKVLTELLAAKAVQCASVD